jgi:hypothetical protein
MRRFAGFMPAMEAELVVVLELGVVASGHAVGRACVEKTLLR